METIIVILIVGLAAGLLGRNYYKKYKKGNQCSCGCTDCRTDATSCDAPETPREQIGDLRKRSLINPSPGQKIQ